MKQRICPPCGAVMHAETDEELIGVVQEHARTHHGVEIDPHHILEEATDV